MPGSPESLPEPNIGPVIEAIATALRSGIMADIIRGYLVNEGFTHAYADETVASRAGIDAGRIARALGTKHTAGTQWEIRAETVESWLRRINGLDGPPA